jgi:16S rRNA (cytosine967-C5)-methyltransferase
MSARNAVTRQGAGARLRAVAAEVDAAVVGRGESLDRALAPVEFPDRRDTALLHAICYAALRWHHRLAWQVGQLLERPLKRKDIELAALLRVGLVQLQVLRIPDHAAVDATVAAASELGLRRATGLVNAVLRRFLRERERLDAAMAGDREALASHPAWLLDLIAEDWPDRAEAIITANNTAAPMWLRVNVARVDPAAYARELQAAGIAAEPLRDRPSAIKLEEPCAATSLPGFAQGLVSVQDAAAQLAAPALGARPGHRVLDACAAPGGKAAHVLELCPDVAELVALDIDPVRLERVVETFARLNLAAEVKCGDAARPQGWWDGRPFERILLDAPCSALGVIRRHPDIKVLRRPGDIAAVAERQGQMLRALWPLLASGGRLLYVTCTFTRTENQRQIGAFLDATPDAELSKPEIPAQVLPGEANMDGFYYACLLKR